MNTRHPLAVLACCLASCGRAPETGPSPPPWAHVSTEQLREASRLNVPVAFEEPVAGLRFVLIPGGTFQMGENSGDGWPDEKPRHAVTLSPFYLSIYEVTNAQYRLFNPHKRERFSGATQPADYVSHVRAAAFAAWLNSQGTQKGYGLPTEAQWEYACRAGTTTKYWSGDGETDLARVGWYFGNSGRQSHPVGQKPPNAWGLYDMHGNMKEACADGFVFDFYSKPEARLVDPVSLPTNPDYFVSRGGSWAGPAEDARSAARFRAGTTAGAGAGADGVRLACSVTAR